MALLEKCLYCDELCSVPASGDGVSSLPLCDVHSGRAAAKVAEAARWAALSVDAKLDELKRRVDELAASDSERWFDTSRPIG
jgi:hypothetical protein